MKTIFRSLPTVTSFKTFGALAVLLVGLMALPAGATIVNLTTGSTASGSGGFCVTTAVDNCGFFRVTETQSTGTGVIDPFYTVQAKGTESGFNTGAANPLNGDMKRGGSGDPEQGFTRAIRVSEFGLVTINGAPCSGAGCYIRFSLDINESSSGGPNPDGNYLSINALQLWVTPTTNTYNTSPISGLPNGVKVYDLDGGATADDVYTDYRLNPGSGAGDVLFYVPYAIFAGHTTDWLYLYGLYGDTGVVTFGNVGCDASNFTPANVNGCDYSSVAGFEEWARIDGAAPVPEPRFVGLALSGLFGLALYIRRRRLA